MATTTTVLASTTTMATTTLPADPTGGAMGNLQSNITSWITAYGVPAVVGLLAVGLIVRLLIRYARRAAEAGS